MHEHRPDVESDLSAFHRIDDIASVHPQRLIDLFVRLPYYQGAVAAILRAETREDEPADWSDVSSDRSVDSSATSLSVDPILGGLIELV